MGTAGGGCLTDHRFCYEVVRVSVKWIEEGVVGGYDDDFDHSSREANQSGVNVVNTVVLIDC